MDKRCACLLQTNIASLRAEPAGVVWMCVELRSFLIHPGNHLKSRSVASQVNCCLLPVPSSFAITRYSICGVQGMSSTCDGSVPPAFVNTSAMFFGNDAS